MNTTARLTVATLITAALAAAVLVQASRTAPAADADIVILPAVQVVGKRAAPPEVVQLPTVVVTAKRATSAATLLAQKADRADAL